MLTLQQISTAKCRTLRGASPTTHQYCHQLMPVLLSIDVLALMAIYSRWGRRKWTLRRASPATHQYCHRLMPALLDPGLTAMLMLASTAWYWPTGVGQYQALCRLSQRRHPASSRGWPNADLVQRLLCDILTPISAHTSVAQYQRTSLDGHAHASMDGRTHTRVDQGGLCAAPPLRHPDANME